MKYSESLGELKYLSSGMKNEKRYACGKKAFNVEVLLSPGDPSSREKVPGYLPN